MIVHRHAEKSLIALGSRMIVPASVVIDRLKKMERLEEDHVALLVGNCNPPGANGDTVVAIVREGNVITVMLRWSHQSFSPSALRVGSVQQMEGIA